MNINDAPYVTRTETAPITIDPKSLEFVNCPMQTPVNQDGEYQLMIALPGGKGLYDYFTHNECEKLKELESKCKCDNLRYREKGSCMLLLEGLLVSPNIGYKYGIFVCCHHFIHCWY